MAAPVIASSSSNKTGNTNADITVTFGTDGPSGIAAGDLLWAEVGASNFSQGSVPPPAIATPSGWSLWVTGEGAENNDVGFLNTRISIFTRIAQGGDTSVSFTATPNSTDHGMTAKVLRITGHDPTSFAHQSAAATGVDGSAITASAVTTSIADCLIIGSAVEGIFGNSPTWASGTWAEQWDFDTSVSAVVRNSQTAATKTQASPGSTGTNVFTASLAGSLAAVTVAIAPAATPINQATETDTAQAFTRRKSKSFGQSVSSHLAQAFSVLRGRALNQVSEVDSPQGITTLLMSSFVKANAPITRITADMSPRELLLFPEVQPIIIPDNTTELRSP